MARLIATFKKRFFNSKVRATEFSRIVNGFVTRNHNYKGMGKYSVDYALRRVRRK